MRPKSTHLETTAGSPGPPRIQVSPLTPRCGFISSFSRAGYGQNRVRLACSRGEDLVRQCP
jgi:hypothetical protein